MLDVKLYWKLTELVGGRGTDIAISQAFFQVDTCRCSAQKYVYHTVIQENNDTLWLDTRRIIIDGKLGRP